MMEMEYVSYLKQHDPTPSRNSGNGGNLVGDMHVVGVQSNTLVEIMEMLEMVENLRVICLRWGPYTISGNSGNCGNGGNHVVDKPEIAAPHPCGNSENNGNSIVEMSGVQPKPKWKY